MAHFRIRYATYNGVFQPCTIKNDISDIHCHKCEFPQTQGSLEKLLLHGKNEANEDSFFLDIWTPDTEGEKPVLFWIHGGAFTNGSSCDPQNDAENLSRNADIIVVSPSYRLGILGTAYYQGIPQQNCGFHDIITALEWTNNNIEKFSGNPHNITIGGQSSGAWYAMAIHTAPRLQHLFKKTILFSWPGSMKAIEPTVAEKIYNSFILEAEKIGKTTYKTCAEIPIDILLYAQKKIGHRNKKKYNFFVPFIPTIEESYISNNFYEACTTSSKKLHLQFTKDECAAYTYKYPIRNGIPAFILKFFLKKYDPTISRAKIKNSLKHTKDVYQTVVEITSDAVFKNPARQIAKTTNATISEFAFPTPKNKTLCCHCFDIVFIFGCFDAWSQSAIFQGCDKQEMKKKSAELQTEIMNFIQ
ncbi:MAG: carboxylesterase family protein [Bacteroidales bacterium]|nr:carboxylesterase family protein [Bacteroidales bacterium]